jgi:C-terminal processing protease CtpA/Prc
MVVKKIVEDSIAEKIGIKVGDKFITINDVSIAQSVEGGAQVVSLLTALTRPIRPTPGLGESDCKLSR